MRLRQFAPHMQQSREELEQLHRAATQRAFQNDVIILSTRFAETAKLEGDMKLDFEEFYAMMPDGIRRTNSSADVRVWFEAADKNHDGVVSIDEFFLWSLGASAVMHGAQPLADVFAKFDRDKTGFLDAREFDKVCEEVGFGASSHDIFVGLDADKTGHVSYGELTAALTQQDGMFPAASFKTKQMIQALVWTWDDADGGCQIDTSDWRIHGTTAESIRTEMQQLLQTSGGHVADLISLFDEDGGGPQEGLIDDVEFVQTLRTRLGYRGNALVLGEVFRSLDLDGSGYIGFDELVHEQDSNPRL